MNTVRTSYLACFLALAFVSPGVSSAQEGENLSIGPISESPVLSPDLSLLAFSSNVGPEGKFDIWIADFDGANPSNLTSLPDSDEKQPDWMPDGQALVFSTNKDSEKFNIWTMSLDGQSLIQLTTTNANDTHPRVAPDGSRIVFLSNRTGKKELWTMNLDGSDQRPIALMSMLVSDPAWAPSSQAVVFVGCPNRSCNLFQTTLSGSVNQITYGEFQDWTPDWGPEGIVFSTNRDRSQSLWLVQPDGSELQMLGADTSGALDPRWTEGGYVVFSRAEPQDPNSTAQIWVRDPFGQTAQLTNLLNNEPPDCTDGTSSVSILWPPNHKFVPVVVTGVTDPDGDMITINIDSIFQDEEVDAKGSGNTSPDGRGVGTQAAELRAERAGNGNGRVYHISFTADDGNGGSCLGEVTVGVPLNLKVNAAAVDDGALYDSTIVP